jgi:hypothetical protein
MRVWHIATERKEVRMAKRQSSQPAADQHEAKQKVENRVETVASGVTEEAAPATRADPADKAGQLKRILQRGKRDKAARREKALTARARASPIAVPPPDAEMAAIEGSEAREPLDRPPETREDAKHRTSAVGTSSTQGGVLPPPPRPSGPPPPKQPHIQLGEVKEARGQVEQLHEAAVKRVQELLDSLVGRRGATPDESKQIANMVYDTARYSGTDLLWKGQRVHIRWNMGIFEARTTDASRRPLHQSADFPQLVARAKAPEKDTGRRV